MDLYNQEGEKVVYTGKGGTNQDKEVANKYLKEGDCYTVERVSVGDFESSVYLEEIEDKFPSGSRVYFNTVMFRGDNEGESEAEYIERVKPTVSELFGRRQMHDAPQQSSEAWQTLFNEVQIWYGDIRKTESEDEFIARISKAFDLRLADKSHLGQVSEILARQKREHTEKATEQTARMKEALERIIAHWEGNIQPSPTKMMLMANEGLGEDKEKVSR